MSDEFINGMIYVLRYIEEQRPEVKYHPIYLRYFAVVDGNAKEDKTDLVNQIKSAVADCITGGSHGVG